MSRTEKPRTYQGKIAEVNEATGLMVADLAVSVDRRGEFSPTSARVAAAQLQAAAYIAKHPEDRASITKALKTFYGVEPIAEVPF